MLNKIVFGALLMAPVTAFAHVTLAEPQAT